MAIFLRLAVACSLFRSLPALFAPTPGEEAPAKDAKVPLSPSPRERISLNHDWHFQKNDPAGNTVPLLEDVRPVVKDARDHKALRAAIALSSPCA